MSVINTIDRINACGGNNNDIPTEPTREDFDQCLLALAENDFPTVSPNSKYGAGPVQDFYYAFVPDDLCSVVSGCKGFISEKDYPKSARIHSDEFGSIGNFRLLKLPNHKGLLDIISLNGNPVYGIIFRNNIFKKGRLVLACTI